MTNTYEPPHPAVEYGTVVDLLCPHCHKELKLAAQSERQTKDKLAHSNRYLCQVHGCGHMFTRTMEV